MPNDQPESSEHFSKILIVRTDRIGDVILTLPMLPLLRACHPGARLAMLLSRYTGEIVEGNPYVDDLLWYDDERRKPAPFGEMVRRLRQEAFDAVVVVHPTPRLAWMMYRARIPVRIGTGYRYYAPLFNRHVFEHRKDAHRHELEYNLQLMRHLGCPAPSNLEHPDYGVRIGEEAEKRVEKLLESEAIAPARALVILHPGSGGSAREWPAESFARLAENLQLRKNVQIIVTGTAGDEAKIGRVMAYSRARMISVAGRLSLKDLAALARSASLFISNSTGPLHLAVAVGTPVLGLYPQITAMSPRRWGPYGGRNAVLVPDKPADCRECSGKAPGSCACMASITVDQAYAAACELLTAQHPHQK